MNNVVLTACTDYLYANIAYFVDSFRKYVSDSDLVIIGGSLSVDTLETLRDRHAKFIDVDQEYLPVNQIS